MMAGTACEGGGACAVRPPFDAYVVLDFEATCKQGVRIAELEVIEFPLVIVDAARRCVVAEFRRYVRPVLHPVLSTFCTELTGITQDMVDRSATFATVYAEALAFLRGAGLGDAAPLRSYCMVTCGDWDLKTMLPAQMRALASRAGPAAAPLEPLPASWRRWCNLKRFMQTANPPILPPSVIGGDDNDSGSGAGGVPRKAARGAGRKARPAFDMPGMLQAVGLPLRGRHHSGLDDCRNIAAVLCTLLERGVYTIVPTWSFPASGGAAAPAQPVVSHAVPLPDLGALVSSVVDSDGHLRTYVMGSSNTELLHAARGNELAKANEASNVSVPAVNAAQTVQKHMEVEVVVAGQAEGSGPTYSAANQSQSASLYNDEARSTARSGHGGSHSNSYSNAAAAVVVRPVVQLDRTRDPLRELLASDPSAAPCCMSKERSLYISHYLSRVLRHSADRQGIVISRNGFAKVDELLSQRALRTRNITRREVAEVVARDDKQRYTLAYGKEGGGNGVLYIAANQGHSLPGVEPYLRPITLAEAKAGMIAVHGTSLEAWGRIRACGYLSPMSRHHIHFARCLPSNRNSVIAGLRRNMEVLIYLDIAKAVASDIQVWESANHVILTAGERGTRRLPLSYVSKVEVRETGEVLYANKPPCSPTTASVTAAAAAATVYS